MDMKKLFYLQYHTLRKLLNYISHRSWQFYFWEHGRQFCSRDVREGAGEALDQRVVMVEDLQQGAGRRAEYLPPSPSTRVMVHGANFGAGPVQERKEGDPPTLEEHLGHCGLGWFQYKIFIMAAAIVAADGMEMTVISLLRKPLSKEWGLDDSTFSLLGSVVFLGLLIGNMIGGSLADIFGRKKCIVGITVIFCVFGTVSAVAPDVWTFSGTRAPVHADVPACNRACTLPCALKAPGSAPWSALRAQLIAIPSLTCPRVCLRASAQLQDSSRG